MNRDAGGGKGRTESRKVVSLFSGAGGLDLGLHQSGWDVLAQIELDRDCVRTLHGHASHLGRETLIVNERVEDIPPASLRQLLHLRRGELGLLAGGPPCQPFTTTGLRQAITDRRASTAFPTYLSFVSEFLPRALLMENVDGMLSAALRHRPLALRGNDAKPLSRDEQKGTFLEWLLGELASLGYSVAWGLVEASDYGVAQRRQRAVLIGIRDSDPCFLPLPTHGPHKRGVKTLRHALRGLRRHASPVQPLSARKRLVFDMIPPGGNWRDLPEHIRRETMGKAFYADGGKSGWWRRLSWDAPAPTILGMPDHSSTALIHPDETRCMSVAECAAIQSFPRWVRFEGSSRSQYQQIGNAVPPLLGQALGMAISAHLAGERDQSPLPPQWRKESANRRIGTHGWVVPSTLRPEFTFIVRLRPDHVWWERHCQSQLWQEAALG